MSIIQLKLKLTFLIPNNLFGINHQCINLILFNICLFNDL